MIGLSVFPARVFAPGLRRSNKRMREEMTNTQSDKFSLINKLSRAGKILPARQILLACALVAACAPLLFAQAALTPAAIGGRVTDTQGAGVAGAIVTLYGRAPQFQRLTAITDAGGAYRFESLAAGEYLIEADARGFAPAIAQKVRLERGQATTLDLALEVAGVRAEVIVTAADTPQPVDEVSKAVTTVGVRELDERDEYSIPEALRIVPGLRVQQLGGPGALLSIKTRGLRNQDTAVTIDGLRFRDPSSPQGDASGYLSDLHVTNVSRVEVLRGSGSSLYGTNAIGGVVNIITDEGGGRPRGSLLAEGGGGLGLFRGRAQVAGGTGANRIVYSAGVSHLNVTRGIDGDDAARTTSGQGRVGFRLTPTATLTARLYAADSFTQLNEDARPVAGALPAGVVRAVPLSRAELRRFETGTPDFQLTNGAATFIPSTNDADAARATRFFSGALIFTHRPADSFGYTISYQGNRTNGAFYDGPAGTGFEPFGTTRADFGGRAHTLNARADFRLGRANLLTAGYEFERERFINRSFTSFAPADDYSLGVVERSHTFFIQDQVRLLQDRLQLSAAFRTQRFTLSRPDLAPFARSPFARFNFEAPPNAYTGDGSIAYSFRTTGTKLRAHVGNGYRAPSLYERFGSFYDPRPFGGGSPQFSAFGDPRLRPERSIAFDAGVDQTFAGARARASATYFYTRLQEVIAFDFSGLVVQPDPFERFGGYVNTRGGLARGVELSLDAAPARTLDVRASYTYTNADERTPRVGGVIRSFTIPDHQFNLTATQRAGRRLLFNFDLSASSDYLAPVFNPSTFGSVVYRFDGNFKADAGANYTLPLGESRSLRFFGYVENLFGQEYFENGFRTPGRTGKAGAQFSF
jgi:iron complex outermembrane receptor protein